MCICMCVCARSRTKKSWTGGDGGDHKTPFLSRIIHREMQNLPDCIILKIIDEAALSASKRAKNDLKAARNIHRVFYKIARLNHAFRALMRIESHSLDHVVQCASRFLEADLISPWLQEAICGHAYDRCWVESCGHCKRRMPRFDIENGGCELAWMCEGCDTWFCDSNDCFGEETDSDLCRLCSD